MFWHSFGQRRLSLRSLLRVLSLSLLLTVFFGGGVARAGDDPFCQDVLVQPGSVCYGPAHTLTSVRGTNEGSGDGCGGAYNYGSYYCANPTGCHTYVGAYVLTPGIRHRSTTTARYMRGEQTYGSTGAGSNCIAGTPFAVSGPLEDASADLGDVPVLDRDKTTAPNAVASLVPSADARTARMFKTPHGSAWVLVDPSSESVCVVADDNGTGYGVSCQPAADAREKGSIATFEDGSQQSAAGDVVFALVPFGVDALTIDRADGSSRQVAAPGGVAVASLTAKDVGVTLDASPDAGRGVQATKESLTAAKPHHAAKVRRHHTR